MVAGSSHEGFEESLAAVNAQLAVLVRDFEEIAPNSFVSGSVYQAGEDDLVVMTTEFSRNAPQLHRDFVNNHIMKRRVAMHGTSVGEVVTSNRDIIFSRSGYRASQFCLNLKLSDSNVLQFVFEVSDYNTPLTDEEVLAAQRFIVDRAGLESLEQALEPFNESPELIQRLFDSYPASDKRDAIILLYDITGSTNIRKKHSGEDHIAFLEKVRALATEADPSGLSGELARSEGDGACIVFPCTHFTNVQIANLFQDRVIPAALNLANAYNRLRLSSDFANAARDSHIRLAVSHSDLKISPIKSRYHKCELHGDGFIATDALSKSAPRDRDVVVVGAALSQFLPGDIMLRAEPLSVSHFKDETAAMFSPD